MKKNVVVTNSAVGISYSHCVIIANAVNCCSLRIKVMKCHKCGLDECPSFHWGSGLLQLLLRLSGVMRLEHGSVRVNG